MIRHPLPPHVQRFFAERLTNQLGAIGHTLASYRDTFRLLLNFASDRLGRMPTDLTVDDIDADLVGRFLEHLETERGNGARSRNARLTAIRSFFADIARNEPGLLQHCSRILAMPHKQHERRMIEFLTEEESQELLRAPDLSTPSGRRDRALLLLALQTGLRVSELIHLNCGDVMIEDPAHVRCAGRGRKQCATPLREWRDERFAGDAEPLFLSNQNSRLSRDAVERLVRKHVARASERCPSLEGKRVSPLCRYSAAMSLLREDISVAVIALWLGRESVESTMKCLHADIKIKERAMVRTRPADVEKGRYQPSDPPIAFLATI